MITSSLVSLGSETMEAVSEARSLASYKEIISYVRIVIIKKKDV